MEDTSKIPNHVHVKVDSSDNVFCEPNPVPADGRDIKLKFVLKTDGYVFPQADAVVVSNPGTEFPEPSKTIGPDDTKATLLDRNTGPGTFTYTVIVKKVATGEFFRHDPMIDNGP